MRPSHLTLPQVAIAVGVSRAAVLDRVNKREAEYAVNYFGTPMLTWGQVQEWRREREKRAHTMLRTIRHD